MAYTEIMTGPVITDDSGIPALTAAEAEALRTEKGQAAVDEYNRARAEANKPLLDFIAAEGGQIILDIIGYNDAKRCFTEGDFISCVMTVINALPILKIASVLSKIPDAVSAVVRIVKGIRTFKDLKVAGRRLTSDLRDLAQRLIRCKTVAANSHAGPACDVQTKPKRDPHAPPVSDPRRIPTRSPARFPSLALARRTTTGRAPMAPPDGSSTTVCRISHTRTCPRAAPLEEPLALPMWALGNQVSRTRLLGTRTG
ncbi:hypothetical protein AVL48_37825 [Amycolatopsis regifaucium]|uniref:Uncharacterized protein n=1 Tax=Amycolatopsis regifaucium TaxID=546365 RepID=A0A154M8I1_9PSEU|nr:hypothetical protein [Amycolatopsis regifaucium]KZB80915.1 hypothetical protein AVL48_37825 [Amycolatopsis regifaucium]SFJ74809.1 hypothetical protein SAMN04489731_1387 [Amycolatopsis regifaucium]